MLRVTATLFAGLTALGACQFFQRSDQDTSSTQAAPPQPTAAVTSSPATQSAAGATQAVPKAEAPAPMQEMAQMSGAPGAKSKAPPGGRYRKVSELVRFPDFYPGLGQLWVDPGALPVGPFRAYDRNGELVSTILMVPLKDLNAHRMHDEIQGTPEPVNHIDLHFTQGHPGVDEPHYHVILWHVPKNRAEKLQ